MIRPVVQITEDRGWKGTVGRIGDHWLIQSKPKPKPYGPGQFAVYGFDHITLHKTMFAPRPWEWRDVVWIGRVALHRWKRLPEFTAFEASLPGEKS
jgi:hypothetical protein